MTEPKEFFELVGSDDPRLPTVLDLLILDRHDMGRKQAAFRAWPTWRRVGLVLLVNLLLSLALALLWTGPMDAKIAAFCTGWLLSFTYFLCALLGVLAYRQRVCENGLVLGFRGRSLVPWETVDPGRVYIVENFLSAGFHPEFNSLSPTHHAGLADRGISVCGFNQDRDPPFVYWLIVTPRPEKMVAEIEKAMCASGLNAQGLAANAQRTAVRAHRGRGKKSQPLLPPVRGLFDPVIGIPEQQA